MCMVCGIYTHRSLFHTHRCMKLVCCSVLQCVAVSIHIGLFFIHIGLFSIHSATLCTQCRVVCGMYTHRDTGLWNVYTPRHAVRHTARLMSTRCLAVCRDSCLRAVDMYHAKYRASASTCLASTCLASTCLASTCLASTSTCLASTCLASTCLSSRGGGLGSRPKKMYWERLGDGVEYHSMKPTPRR